tara:strand:- start:608 stop:1408 length:801 start_codon:yes stop_codon:yes gene_type:complete
MSSNQYIAQLKGVFGKEEPTAPLDPHITAMKDLAPHLFENVVHPRFEKYKTMTVSETVRSVFPEPIYSNQELEGILWGETGFPSFFDRRLGNSLIEVFMRQLWNARARREFRYSNITILEDEPYAATVNHIKIPIDHEEKPSEYKTIRLDVGEHVTFEIYNNGKYQIKDRDKVTISGTPPPSKPINETPTWEINGSENNKFLITSNVMEIFEKFIKGMGYDYSPDIPLGIFFKWLAAMAECAENESIDDATRSWINSELEEHFKSL